MGAEAEEDAKEAEKLKEKVEQLKKAGQVEEAEAIEQKAFGLEKKVEDARKKAKEANEKYTAVPEPLTVIQTMSKAEIAAMAQQEAIKRLVQATIKEQEVEMNSSQAIKHWDRQSEMIIAKNEQAEDDIEAAKKARKKALEDEERSAEE